MPARKRNAWRVAAERVAEAVSRGRLHPRVTAWADGCGDEPWAIACSGGADSIALVLLVWAHWPERRKRCRVLHFNHRLRGKASDQDEAFCRKVCAALGMTLRVGRWTDAKAGASEAEAREARFAFFRTEMDKAGARALWTGHQQDDIAETMLMRIARGSGASGLAAPRPVQRMADGRVHLRPLLTLGKGEIETMLKTAGVKWRVDATNSGRKFLRNRMRNVVVPAWREAVTGRDAVRGAALSRQLIEEDDEALERWVDELRPIGARGELRLRRLAGKPRGVVRRAVLRWLAHQGRASTLSRQALEALIDDVGRGRRTQHSVGADAFAVIGRAEVKFVTTAERLRGNSTVVPIDL
jgi:tRNA(Ile)-lysidine synthetase, N-terminal domain